MNDLGTTEQYVRVDGAQPDVPESHVCHWCQRLRRYGRWALVPVRYGLWHEDVWTCRTCDREGDVE